MKYTYLLINILSFIIPFIFSFHPKIEFYKTWKAFFPSVFLAGFLFVVGDMLFTDLGVWGFNSDYLSGIQIANLPIEEILFFFCIPYACIFTYHCFDRFYKFGTASRIEKWITLPFILLLLAASIIYHDRLYTFSAGVGLAILLIYIRFIYNANWLGKFYVIYLVLLIPFIIVNGLLTGTALEKPVVWYNNAENMGYRLMTIPFEDIFYGMSLILLNVLFFEFFKRKYRIRVQQGE